MYSFDRKKVYNLFSQENIEEIPKIHDSIDEQNELEENTQLIGLINELEFFPPFEEYLTQFINKLIDYKFTPIQFFQYKKFHNNLLRLYQIQNNLVQKCNDEFLKKLSENNKSKKLVKSTNNSSKKSSNSKTNKEKKSNKKISSFTLTNNNINENEDVFGKLLNKINSEFIQKNTNNEYIINDKSEIKYILKFQDTSNLTGSNYESSSILLLSKIILCFSEINDFSFIYNYIPNLKEINEIFNKNGLQEIDNIEFDFIINMDCKLFKKTLNYLSPNIIYLKYNNQTYEKDINDDNYLNVLNDVISNNLKENKISILGEIGNNIFGDKRKIEQLLKYGNLLNTL
jgi:hypothetical protein